MKPRKESQNPQLDVFKIQLERIIDSGHPLAKLSDQIDWDRFDEAFEKFYCPDNGRPAIRTRLMVGLHYLKYIYDMSDEGILAGWLENSYWHYF